MNETQKNELKAQPSKTELKAQYKEREVVGGVYAIRNTRNNKVLLDAASDLRSIRNRFDFAVSTNSCVNVALQADWSAHGADAFAFEVLEELKKGETQTSKEFRADVALLKDLWLDKMSAETLY